MNKDETEEVGRWVSAQTLADLLSSGKALAGSAKWDKPGGAVLRVTWLERAQEEQS